MESLLKYEEAAAKLRISPASLRQMVYRKQIGCVKVGRSVRFTEEQLEAYVRQHSRKAKALRAQAAG